MWYFSNHTPKNGKSLSERIVDKVIEFFTLDIDKMTLK